jgi:ABC-type sugar transport system permease subunit
MNRARAQEHAWAYAFLAPMLVLTGTFVIYPIFGSFRMAFYNWDGFGRPSQWVGWRHFMSVAKDPFFWSAFRHTATYTGILVPIQLGLALGLAIVLSELKLKGSNSYRTLYFVPVVTSAAIVGIVMSLLLGNVSTQLSSALMSMGLITRPINLLGDPRFSLYAVIAVGVWHSFGYNLVYFMAALQSVPPEIYDAAKVDGASPLQRFLYVTLPSIKSVGVVILFLAILGSLGVFDLVLTLTNGGPYYSSDVVSTYVYGYAFTSARGSSQANFGFASAASIFMGFMVMGITVLQLLAIRVSRKKDPA